MPTVAQIVGGVRIEQYYGDHNPPHFHACKDGQEALIEIATPFSVYRGSLKPGALQDVIDWAKDHQAELALNWVESLAGQQIKGIA